MRSEAIGLAISIFANYLLFFWIFWRLPRHRPRQAGWFDTCRGFLIGRPGVQGQIIAGLDQYEAVLSILDEFDVPVLMDLDIGHVAPMMPLICGSYAKVAVTGNDCLIAMSLR